MIDRYRIEDGEAQEWANQKLVEIAATSLEAFREALKKMTDDERYILLRELHDGYCRHCGSDDGWRCSCMNDE